MFGSWEDGFLNNINYCFTLTVLDMARHIPLYRSILLLLRVMALSSQLVRFLLPADFSTRQSTSNDCSATDQTISLVELLQKMKICVDTYSSRLKCVIIYIRRFPNILD